MYTMVFTFSPLMSFFVNREYRPTPSLSRHQWFPGCSSRGCSHHVLLHPLSSIYTGKDIAALTHKDNMLPVPEPSDVEQPCVEQLGMDTWSLVLLGNHADAISMYSLAGNINSMVSSSQTAKAACWHFLTSAAQIKQLTIIPLWSSRTFSWPQITLLSMMFEDFTLRYYIIQEISNVGLFLSIQSECKHSLAYTTCRHQLHGSLCSHATANLNCQSQCPVAEYCAQGQMSKFFNECHGGDCVEC